MKTYSCKTTENMKMVWKPLCLLKRYLILPTIIVLAFGAALIGCGGNRQDESEPFPPSVARSVFVSGPDAYVAGQKYDPSQKKYVATLWKNGAPQYLETQFASSVGNSVFVSGGDVYVAGIQTKTERTDASYLSYNGYATLWKNGAPQILGANNYRGVINSVFVSGEDVYVAGAFDDAQGIPSIILKNGVPQPTDFNNGYGLSVYVANGDVYVAGNKTSISDRGKSIAMLWKNGVAQNLNENIKNVTGDAYATSVFVSNEEDVYVAGHFEFENYLVPILWKNGKHYYSPRTFIRSEANSVFVAESDSYVVGYTRFHGSMLTGPKYASLWKNDEQVQFLPADSRQAQAYSVFVSDGDVYIAGVEGIEGQGASARLWKNGVAQELK